MKTLTCAIAALLMLSGAACAPATPTVDPAMIQASAVAAANAMVAMTQAAMPTDTPIPPTPQPSPTFFPSPTLSLLAVPTLSGASLPPPPAVGAAPTGDACSNAPMAPKPAGPMQNVKISNDSGGSVILSLYLNKTPFGECGYRGFNLSRGDVITTSLPEGCYFGGAFVNSKKIDTKAFGTGCLSGPGGGVVSVGTEVISFNSKR
jgi:hypothetical protein